MSHYTVCAKCGTEIRPGTDFDRRYRTFEEGAICPECFRDMLRDLIDTDLDAMAYHMGIPVDFAEEE